MSGIFFTNYIFEMEYFWQEKNLIRVASFAELPILQRCQVFFVLSKNLYSRSNFRVRRAVPSAKSSQKICLQFVGATFFNLDPNFFSWYNICRKITKNLKNVHIHFKIGIKKISDQNSKMWLPNFVDRSFVKILH